MKLGLSFLSFLGMLPEGFVCHLKESANGKTWVHTLIGSIEWLDVFMELSTITLSLFVG